MSDHVVYKETGIPGISVVVGRSADLFRNKKFGTHPLAKLPDITIRADDRTANRGIWVYIRFDVEEGTTIDLEDREEAMRKLRTTTLDAIFTKEPGFNRGDQGILLTVNKAVNRVVDQRFHPYGPTFYGLPEKRLFRRDGDLVHEQIRMVFANCVTVRGPFSDYSYYQSRGYFRANIQIGERGQFMDLRDLAIYHPSYDITVQADKNEIEAALLTSLTAAFPKLVVSVEIVEAIERQSVTNPNS